MTPAPLLTTSQLRCAYGADEVVHGIDFYVAPGEVVTILGPNGCGKTTFVKAILGYVTVTAGAVRFRDRDLRPLRPPERAALGIGYVPQLLNVFKPLTVGENLEIGGYRLGRRERSQRLEEAFALFPVLGERRSQKAGTLSGGERQLLAMARALIVSPELIFLDEPSAGLSPIRADDVFSHVRRIADTGTAVAIVEQDVHRALAISARAYVLVTGRVAFEGPAESIAGDDRIRTAYLGARTTGSPDDRAAGG